MDRDRSWQKTDEMVETTAYRVQAPFKQDYHEEVTGLTLKTFIAKDIVEVFNIQFE